MVTARIDTLPNDTRREINNLSTANKDLLNKTVRAVDIFGDEASSGGKQNGDGRYFGNEASGGGKQSGSRSWGRLRERDQR